MDDEIVKVKTVSSEKASRINRIVGKAKRIKDYMTHTRKLDRIDTSALNLSIYAEDYNKEIGNTGEFERKEVFNMQMTPELLDVITKYLSDSIDETLEEFKHVNTDKKESEE